MRFNLFLFPQYKRGLLEVQPSSRRTFLSESTGGRPANNHAMMLDIAKEISMIQRNEKEPTQY